MKASLSFTIALSLFLSAAASASEPLNIKSTQLGPRPFYLVDELDAGPLKRELSRCAARRKHYEPSDFSIGHRGSALQFPEHTTESYVSAARMGAGILECDVSFTSDAALVCRHDQCDLHTTTNIVATDLARHCTVPPEVDPVTGELLNGPAIKCCTSDLTLAQFKTLDGKMDAADRSASTIEGYLGGTADFRTDLYATGAELLTHAESIELIHALGRKFTPELKGPDRNDPQPKNTLEDVFGPLAEPGQTPQQAYAAKFIEEYIHAGIDPATVWAQSFNADDVFYWIDNYPRYGEQAVFLEGRNPVALVDAPPPQSEFDELVRRGLNILAPPMPALLTSTSGGDIVPSTYARRARKAGLELISWTIERSGRVNEDIVPSGGAFYYNTTVDALASDGDILRTMDVLVQDVGIFGLFSDWPATTTFYANCKDIPRLGIASRPRRGGDDRPRYGKRGDDDDDDDDERSRYGKRGDDDDDD